MGRATLGEQVAVLDGLDEGSSTIDYDMSDNFAAAPRNVSASGGANYGGGSNYSKGLPLLPSGVGLAGANVSASGGANYSGGSNYSKGLPILPSGIGLAGALPARRNVIDPSGGGNYTGGSSWTGGLPLTPSNAGLAGLGQVMAGADGDLAGAFASIEDARQIAPNVLLRRNVVDPSGGANYSGGSSWTGGMPLLPSNAGLAGLDAMSDNVLATAAAKLRARGAIVNTVMLKNQAGQAALKRLKTRVAGAMRSWAKMTPAQKTQAKGDMLALNKVRLARANLVKASAAR